MDSRPLYYSGISGGRNGNWVDGTAGQGIRTDWMDGTITLPR